MALIFAVWTIVGFWAKRGGRGRAILVLLLAAVSLPSTLQYVAKNSFLKTPQTWSRGAMAALPS
ncbi:MAG: hypothetical protein P4M00_00450 [Azospirillaceae bacterium]|nr:hypothetical protein [Azospirillaceae bacterium]